MLFSDRVLTITNRFTNQNDAAKDLYVAPPGKNDTPEANY